MRKPHQIRQDEIREYWMRRRAAWERKKAWHTWRTRTGYGRLAREAVTPEKSGAADAKNQLTQLRLRAGMTVAQLAQRMRVERSTIHRMENGARAHMTLNALEKYANACGFEVRVEFLESMKEKVPYVKIEG